MPTPDTSLPPGGPGFRTTAWSVIRDAQADDRSSRARALDRLASVYWRPVYWTLRLDWTLSHDEAKDATQDYFALFLEREMFLKVAPQGGRFRAYVKATLKNFMIDRGRASASLKRGGGAATIPLDSIDRMIDEPAAGDPPERRFERELMRGIIEQSMAALERACADEGRPELFRIFKTYYAEIARGGEIGYAELQAEFGIGWHEVKNRLSGLRARFRDIMISHLRDGVSSEEDLVAEIREVFGP